MLKQSMEDLIFAKSGQRILYADDLQNRSMWAHIVMHGRDILKSAGVNTKVHEYLSDHGLLVKLERDMRVLQPRPREKFENLLEYIQEVFKTYPIFGMARFNEQDSRQLFQLGYDAFQKLDLPRVSLTAGEQDALVMSTVQLLKSRQTDEGDDTSLWPYIYKQFGYKGHEEAWSQRIYQNFRVAIRDVTRRYDRFFAPKGTQRYYTTLMLHALAPKHGFFNLFEILVRFFEKNLEFQYLPDDPSYQVFVERIKTRWGVPSELERLGLYSAAVHSGLKTLFLNRSAFMAFFCENIVHKINQLLKTGVISDSVLQGSYLDEMLIEWYQEKSIKVRNDWSASQRAQEGERTIASAKDANPQYVLHDNRVSLFIPNIRLASTDMEFPRIKLYQDDVLVYSKILNVFGDDLSWTIRKSYLYLDETFLNFHQNLSLRMEIVHNNEIIFDSHERLFRPFLFFTATGVESRPENLKSGLAYLFATNDAELESLKIEETVQLDHPGKLLEVYPEILQDLRIDGLEVFLPDLERDKVRVYLSHSSVSGVHALKEGKVFQVYNRSFDFMIHLPANESPLSYLVQSGQAITPLSSCLDEKRQVCLLKSDKPGEFSELTIKNFITSAVVYTHRYVVLPEFELKYSEPFYLSNRAKVQGTMDYQGESEVVSGLLHGEENINFVTQNGTMEFILTPPLFRCELLGKELFIQEQAFWHKDIKQDTYLNIVLPEGWRAKVHFGNQTIAVLDSQTTFDLGNFLSSYPNSSTSQPLWFTLFNTLHERRDVFACTIYLRPSFTQAPLLIDDGRLIFNAVDHFVGDQDSAFIVKLRNRHSELANYQASVKNEVLEDQFPFQAGRFSYQIYLLTSSLFSRKEELIYLGAFSIGNEHMLRFDGQHIHLESSICWNMRTNRTEKISVRKHAARISEIEYLGMSIPSGESYEFPEYKGTLSFYNFQKEEWQPFSSDEENEEYELINPVRFWPINDDMIIVNSCTGDGLYFDKSRNWFMNRDPSMEMHKELIFAIATIPDYYTYRKENE